MKNPLILKRLALLAVLAVAVMAMVIPSVMGQQIPPDVVPNTITVTGVGEASSAPDMATVSLGVELSGQDVTTVYSDVNAALANIKSALEGIGIAPGDISTASFNIYTINMGDGTPSEIRVGNTLNVVVRDLTLIESVLDTAVGAGANAVYGLTFDVSDKAALEAEARTNALADANDRAQQLATGVNVTVGEVVAIVELNNNFGFPLPMAEQGLGGGGGALIEPGQFTYTLSVQVTYSFNR
jgi:uncharacterized protein YggE